MSHRTDRTDHADHADHTDRTTSPTRSSLRTAYSIAAGAAAAAAGSASADIVYSGVQDISIDQFSALDLDLDFDGYGDVLLKNYVFYGGNYQGATVNFFPGQLVGFYDNGLAYVASLAAGFSIDGSSVGPTFFGSMAYGTSNPSAQFNAADGAFLGLSFAAGADTHYAWVRVTIDNAAGSFVVNDWAYEGVAGTGIAAGVVPAPGTLALLAAGSGGLGLLRGRKRSG